MYRQLSFIICFIITIFATFNYSASPKHIFNQQPHHESKIHYGGVVASVLEASPFGLAARKGRYQSNFPRLIFLVVVISIALSKIPAALDLPIWQKQASQENI